ncbi:hypothetical protein BDV32DRAFT_22938 [Aspergillus pseudonomiae]|nr:hypothetical protein BDV32DRAFT_22938 [Aspergillus pseudonomiae]
MITGNADYGKPSLFGGVGPWWPLTVYYPITLIRIGAMLEESRYLMSPGLPPLPMTNAWDWSIQCGPAPFSSKCLTHSFPIISSGPREWGLEGDEEGFPGHPAGHV